MINIFSDKHLWVHIINQLVSIDDILSCCQIDRSFRSDDLWRTAIANRYPDQGPENLSWKQYYPELVWSIHTPIDIGKTQEWRLRGQLHRLAVICMEHNDVIGKFWHQNDKLHRDGDLPAMISGRGKFLEWYKLGNIHRDGHGSDKPAVIMPDGIQEWSTSSRQ